MTRNKIRRLELLAGAPPQKGRAGVPGGKSKAVFDAARALSSQAEAAHQQIGQRLEGDATGHSGRGRDTVGHLTFIRPVGTGHPSVPPLNAETWNSRRA